MKFRDIMDVRKPLLFLFALVLCAPALVLAADIAAPDYTATLANVITALVPFVVPIVVYGVRLVLPAIPRVVLPFIALGFGVLLDFLGSLASGGESNVLRGALLGAAGVFVREVLNTLNEHGVSASFKNTVSVLLIGSLGLVGLQGCASTQTAKKDATVALAAARSALDLTEQTLLRTECGKAAAPAPPACVPPDVANKAFSIIADAAAVGEKASGAIRALPPSVDGSLTSPQISGFITQIWDLINQIRVLFPQSTQASKLSSDLDKLAAKR